MFDHLHIGAVISEWIKYFVAFFHHHGHVPSPPKQGAEPVTLPPVPAPVTPAPAPAPQPIPPASGPTTPAPSAPVLAGSAAPVALPPNVGALDVRGFASYPAIQAEFENNPIWAKYKAFQCKWFGSEGLPETFDLRANLTQAKEVFLSGGSVNKAGFDMTHVAQAYVMSVDDRKTADGHAVGFGYLRGGSEPDALCFAGDNYDAAGNKTYTGFRPENVQAFIAGCNAAVNRAIALGQADILIESCLPVIDHSHQGPVAH